MCGCRIKLATIGAIALLAFILPPLTTAQDVVDDLVVAAWLEGDFSTTGGTRLSIQSLLGPPSKPFVDFDIPAGGGTARLKIADNNKALPQDRFYFMYNHFQNALQVQLGPGADPSGHQFSVSRYTVGFEKTLFDDWFSFEVRAPFIGTYEFFSDDFSVMGENAGDLALITKQLIGRTENASAVVGLGVNLPTGTDVNGNVRDVHYTIQNETVHFVPYVGYLAAPNPATFFHAFLQLDTALNGNPVLVTSSQTSMPGHLGTLNDQVLLSIDVGAGRWLYRDDYAPYVTGFAAMAELHYTTALQDADQIGGVVNKTVLQFGNNVNRSDILNLTVGLHVEIALDTSLRVGASVPLRNDPDRNYDAEVLAQIIHRFGTSQSRPSLAPIVSRAGFGL